MLTVNDIAYNGDAENPVYVAVGNSPTTPNTIMRSTDGLTWTGVGMPVFNFAGLKVIFVNSKFVAIGFTFSSDNLLGYSDDGTNWTGALPMSAPDYPYAIIWTGDRYLIGGYDSTNNVSILKYSTDLVTFTDVENTFEYIGALFKQ